LDDILYYDPVEEIFTVSKSVEERAFALDQELAQHSSKDNYDEGLYDEEHEQSVPPVTIAEMDDDVLLSSETEFDDQQNEGDDIMTQLKKRREQLQSIVASAEQEERFGYRRLPARAKEREARLNHLRECIIPGKTILVLDTNCFIGHIDYVQKLLQAKKWSIIVPLVVVTELDGLRTNPHRLGTVAQQGIELLESTLAAAKKSTGSNSLRIQTSHNNFMNDISIRSEQFVFGETDKNLDDLILSSCLWWISQQPKDKIVSGEKTVPVCLVTGDRNLSVKARARDVEVVPVSAIIQLTPKE
jgi:rRNA-processing protein FCF1